jgi:DNA-cytosine methyltransferase
LSNTTKILDNQDIDRVHSIISRNGNLKSDILVNLNQVTTSENQQQFKELTKAFINNLAELSVEYQKSKEHYGDKPISTISHDRKDNGIYYTDVNLALNLAGISVQNYIEINGIEKLSEAKFLEPCNGIGIFTFAYLIESQKLLEKRYKTNWREKLQDQISNVYVVDVDSDALVVYKFLLKKFCSIFAIELNLEKLEQNVWEEGLIYKVNKNGVEWIDFNSVKQHFNLNKSFDIIITNPPYKKLKAEKQQFSSVDQFEKAKQIYSEVTTNLRKNSILNYSIEGTLNLYKLFSEAIIEEYTNSSKSIVGLLIPYNILTDLQCQKLRHRILENHRLIEVITFEENNKFFNDSTQSLCYLLIEVKGITTEVKFLNNIVDIDDFLNPKYINTPINLITKLTSSKSIVPLIPVEKSILEKTIIHKLIQQYEEITVLRGELDVTLGKKFIVDKNNKEDGSFPLIRGNALGNDYILKEIPNKEWVLIEEFKKKSPQKTKLFSSERIACQQIVNMKKRKRISFSKIEPGNVLANSCNFLTVNSDLMTLDSLLGFMNSSFVDWRFKITSSNNHVNNYELLELPLPNPRDYNSVYDNIHVYVGAYTETFNEKYLALIDSEVFKSFDFSVEEVIHILSGLQKPINYITKVLYLTFIEKVFKETFLKDLERLEANPELKKELKAAIDKKYYELAEGKIFNHFIFKLSDLDIEMVKNVPPSGNWKNIPEEVVGRSERLKKISQTGGRTTLYGRLDWSKPSYTVTTYFNRPGNGTYVHPTYNSNNIEETQNRVITPREAARLQSFPDNFQFIGNKKDLLLQIGNAVPPLLAFQIASQVKEKLECKNAIDLFSGAGGMSEGFRNAGINILVSNDFAESACKTYQLNHPETKVIHGDITLQETKNKIYELIGAEKIDIIFGGPPCQGFSTAGKRLIDDPRNYLFKEYVEVVKVIKPKIFIMENVEGLLSSNGGKTFESILEYFKELGYNVEGRKLNTVEYGVPQKRKRVIVIGVKTDIDCKPSSLFPKPLFTEENTANLELFEEDEKINSYVNVEEAFSTLPIEVDEENNFYTTEEISPYALLMKNILSFDQFIKLKRYVQQKNTNECL